MAVFPPTWCLPLSLALLCASLLASLPAVHCYDPLDPTGNVTIVWDITGFTGDGYTASVRLYNYQYFRKIEMWELTWNWTNNEVIWSMTGAETKEMGDCGKVAFSGGSIPHCCMQVPTIIDLDPSFSATYKNCCKDGYLSPFGIDLNNSLAAFQVVVRNDSSATNIYGGGPYTPSNFSLGIDGYTCTEPYKVNATKFTTDGKRLQQVLLSYNIVCTYSPANSVSTPSCCVSLSAFYSKTIVPCRSCGCACGNYSKKADICDASGSEYLPYLSDGVSNEALAKQQKKAILCSPDGCPLSIHYHIKVNYRDYWRAKVTVINRQLNTNYSSWNLVMMHPNFSNFTQAFSFNLKTVQPYGVNNTALFWGKHNHNEHLMVAGKNGYIQSELLFAKIPEFTFSDGWAFPRRVMFNGEECVLPDEFPMLPDSAFLLRSSFFVSMTVVAAHMALLLLF